MAARSSKVTILNVPYDSGYRDTRMGRGPERILSVGLLQKLADAGIEVESEVIEAPVKFHTEVTTAFQLNRILAKRVHEATQKGRFPILLSGNCGCSIGLMSGLPQDSGVIWFDAHGDFNTPETTLSGFLDGMALAILTGKCWTSLSSAIDGFRALPESKALLVGARDVDEEEGRLIQSSGLEWIRPQEMQQRFIPALVSLKSRTPAVHLHFDLDVLDPALAPANQYVAPNGLTPNQLIDAAKLITDRFEITSICIAAYDPEFDPDAKAARVACDLILGLLLHQR
ncbi:arginase family protein [bacterium]|nr:arginase family protein [bacterium]